MKTNFTLLACLGTVLLMTGCGTVSHVTTAPGKDMRLEKYQRVLVLDFADEVTAKAKPAAREKKKLQMDFATKSFADRIAMEVGALKGFREVLRAGNPDGETLIISGTISRYEEGDSSLRLWIGMGAGSAYFDATVELKDGETKELLADQKIDQNSWGAGGAIAASQTTETFMQAAAKKLAKDLTSIKLTGKLPERKPATTGKRE